MLDHIISAVSRDLNELVRGGPIGWIVLAALLLLPVLAVALLVKGGRLAAVPLVIYLLVWAEILVYYGTGYRPNLGMGFEMLLRFVPMLVAWILLAVAGWRVVRRRRTSVAQRA